MISFLEGTIEHIGEKSAIICAGGIGYTVIVSPKVLTILSKNKTSVNSVKLHIHSQLNMREGTFDMYGFTSREDLDLFHLLTTVSGIGPKGAQNILSSVEPSHLRAAVVNEDAEYLRKVSGIGPKVAQRLVLELKGKVASIGNALDGIDLGQEGHATEALLALGYSQHEAKNALKESKGETLQERVREALKILGRK